MNGFRSTRLDLAAIRPSKFASSMSDRDENDDVGTRLQSRASIAVRAEGSLCDAPERNDWKVLSPSVPPYADLQHGSGLSSHERMRRRTRRSARPSPTRFESRPAVRREFPEVDLVGSACAESRMRPIGVVPSDEMVELASERGLRERDDRQQTRALGLQRLDEALDDRDAPVLADRPKALVDPATSAPRVKAFGRELRPVVAEKVVGQRADLADRSVQKPLDGGCRWLLLEGRVSERAPREVVGDDRDPPTEGSAQRKREREPGDPEATDS